MTKKKVEKQSNAGVINKRYTDEKLEMFKKNILAKIQETEKMRDYHREVIGGNKNGTDDTACSLNELKGGNISLTKEEAQSFYKRDVDFIRLLNNGLIRIQNKTYGICCVTKELISEDRMIAVPHATKSVLGKEIEEKKNSNGVSRSRH